MVRDVGLAEELAQEALVSALETWPEAGVPDNPGAWLMAAAKNRALDHFRRAKMLAQKHAEFALEQEVSFEPDWDDDIGDDLLRLVFTACHPVLSTEARAALTLRLLGGLTTDRSEEHTSELQSRLHLVCRLLLEKKNTNLHWTTQFVQSEG